MDGDIVVTVKMRPDLVEKIDRCVKAVPYMNRSDFIRVATYNLLRQCNGGDND
jgi:metal-responsive CopG/Arc/MetJ family transcriptional regulator